MPFVEPREEVPMGDPTRLSRPRPTPGEWCPTEDRKVCKVAIGFEELSAILRGDLSGEHWTNAPADVKVVGLCLVPGSMIKRCDRVSLYVHSVSFEPVPEGNLVPEVYFTYAKVGPPDDRIREDLLDFARDVETRLREVDRSQARRSIKKLSTDELVGSLMGALMGVKQSIVGGSWPGLRDSCLNLGWLGMELWLEAGEMKQGVAEGMKQSAEKETSDG